MSRAPLVVVVSAFVLSGVLVITGCGGGSSSSNPTPPSSTSNPVPEVTSVTPSSVTAGAADTTLAIVGTGFVSGSTAQWNGVALATTYDSASSLSAALPSSDLADGTTAKVTVSNAAPGGGASPAVAFTVNNPVPAITAVTPGSVTAGAGDTTLDVTGTRFVPSTAINLNGATLTTSFVSGTEVKALLPAANSATLSAAVLTATSPAPVGGTSAGIGFLIDSPIAVITSISPSSVQAGAQATITLTGGGFEASSIVQWNGSAESTTYVNGAALNVVLPAASLQNLGKGQLTVSNPAPNANTSLSAILNVTSGPVPVITSLTPSSAALNTSATGWIQVVITGKNFPPDAVVLINSSPIAPSSVGATSITVEMPAYYTEYLAQLLFQVEDPTNPPVISAGAPFDVIGSPTISSITPSAAPLGSPDLKVVVSGTGFYSDSLVLWNGVTLPTTYSATNGDATGATLTATIPAADMATLTGGNLAVDSPEEAPETQSASQVFSVYLLLQTNNLVSDPVNGLLYASVPSSAGPTLGNSVVGIDPITGVVAPIIPVGSEPDQLAISDDGKQLYVRLDGDDTLQQVDLTNGTAGIKFPVAGSSLGGLAVVPGEPNSVAVYSSSSELTIFDSGIPRPNVGYYNLGSSPYFDSDAASIAFDSSASTIYVLEAGPGLNLNQFSVGSNGIMTGSYPISLGDVHTMQFDGSRLYLSDGTVRDANGTLLGQFMSAPYTPATGPAVSDSLLGRIFILRAGIEIYDEFSFAYVDIIPISGVGSPPNSLPSKDLVRWGSNGLAFTTQTQVYSFTSPIVNGASAVTTK